MKRPLRILLGSGVVLVGSGLLLIAVLPGIIHSRAVSALHGAGYPAAAIGAVHLHWNSATVDDFTLSGDDHLRIASTTVTWHWSGLLAGRVDDIVIDRLVTTLDVGLSGVDPTPFLPVGTTAPAAKPSGGTAWPADIPVERVHITGSQVTLRHGELHETVALTANATNLGHGAVQLQAEVSGTIGTLVLSGSAGPSSQDLRLDLTKVALEHGAALAGRAGLPPVQATGRIRWDGSAQVAVTLTAPSGRLMVNGTWDGTAPGAAVRGTIGCEQLALGPTLAVLQPWLPPLPVSGLGGTADGTLAVTYQTAAGPAGSPATWSAAGTLAIAGLTATHPRGSATLQQIAWSGRVADTGSGPRMTGAITISGGDLHPTPLPPLPALTITLPSAVISSDGERWLGQARVGCDGADLTLDGEADATGSRIACRFLAAAIDLAAWRDRLHLALPVDVTGTASARGQATSLAGAWTGTATLDVDSAVITDPGSHWRAAAGHLTAEGGASWLEGTPLRARAVLTVSDGAVEATAAGVAISGLAGTFPWALGEDPGLTGDLTGIIAAHGQTVPVRLRARLLDQTLRGRAEVKLFGLLDASADGTVGFLPGDLTADLTLEVPRTTISDGAALARLVPAAAGTTATGAISASGALRYAGGALTPKLHVDLSDGVIDRPGDGLHVEGITVGVEVTGLTPPSTAPLQPFSIRSLTVKEQHAERCDGWFQYTDGKILLHQLGLDWAGGRIGCPDGVIDLAAHTFTGDFCANRIALSDLLLVLAPGKLTGGGQLNARMPLIVDWAEPRITLGEGYLRADPEEGWLRITDRSQVASWIGAGGMVDASLRTQVVDTVRDFRFNKLEARTSRPAGGGLLTKVSVAGLGRTGPNPLELGGLTFNIRGVEAALTQALRLQRAPAAPPADSTLDRFFGN